MKLTLSHTSGIIYVNDERSSENQCAVGYIGRVAPKNTCWAAAVWIEEVLAQIKVGNITSITLDLPRKRAKK